MPNYSDLAGLVAEHESWRQGCMNLVAAENMLSPAVRRLLNNDLVQRYGNFGGRDLTDRRYNGNRYIQEIELTLMEIVRQVFGVSEVEIRAISGHVAGLAVIMGTCRPGDTVLELAGHDGGHRLAEKANQSPLIDLQVRPLPFDPQRYNVDADAACTLIVEERPRLVILGASNFLFPHPVRQIAECIAAHTPTTVLAYDASHVFGLVACKTFQDPMGDGAHVAFGSTHKTLPGPQGGLIIANDARLMEAIGIAVYPGIVTNHHLMREPALGAALLEMQDNPDYGPAVVRNAKALGRRLHDHGLAVVGAEHGFTESHTLLLNTRGLGKGKAVAQQLEEVDIIVSYTSLPPALGGEGVRLGSAEPTRLGATEDDMARAGDLIADCLHGRVDRTRTQAAVREWTSRLDGMAYAGLEQPVAKGG